MINYKKILSQKGVQILLFAGILKLVVYILFRKLSITFDLISSAIVLLLFLVIIASLIFKKVKINLRNVFIVGYLTMVLYNWGIGVLGFTTPMATAVLLKSGLDLGLAAVIVGFVMGARKWR